jgi:hypothetical protein
MKKLEKQLREFEGDPRRSNEYSKKASKYVRNRQIVEINYV